MSPSRRRRSTLAAVLAGAAITAAAVVVQPDLTLALGGTVTQEIPAEDDAQGHLSAAVEAPAGSDTSAPLPLEVVEVGEVGEQEGQSDSAAAESEAEPDDAVSSESAAAEDDAQGHLSAAEKWCLPVVSAAENPAPLRCWLTLSEAGELEGLLHLFTEGDVDGVNLGALPAHFGAGDQIVADIEAAYLRWEQEEQERQRAEAEAAAEAEERARQQRQRTITPPPAPAATPDLGTLCGIPVGGGYLTEAQLACLASGGTDSGGGGSDAGWDDDGWDDDGSDQPPVGTGWDGPVEFENGDFPPPPEHCGGNYRYDPNLGYICL